MPIVNVLGADLRWADDVACVQDNGTWKPTVRQTVTKDVRSTCRKKHSLCAREASIPIPFQVTDESGDVDVVCFLNEPCVRKGAYQVPHYVVDGRLVWQLEMRYIMGASFRPPLALGIRRACVQFVRSVRRL